MNEKNKFDILKGMERLNSNCKKLHERYNKLDLEIKPLNDELDKLKIKYDKLLIDTKFIDIGCKLLRQGNDRLQLNWINLKEYLKNMHIIENVPIDDVGELVLNKMKIIELEKVT